MNDEALFYPTKRVLVCEKPPSSRAYDIVATYRSNGEKNALKLAYHGFLDCPRRVHDLCLSDLPIRREDLRILPYSHGLDSFALRALELEASSQRSLVLLTSGGEPPGWSVFQSRYGPNRVEHVTLPLHTTLSSRQSRDREPSNRSRAFVFGVAAGVTAYFCQSSTILCAEAGQGSLGPWLDPVGPESPDIRTHPLLSRLLEDFVKVVLDHQVTFHHPRLWSTKGQTLKELVDLGLHGGWETTFSCADRRKFTVLDGSRVNCGACSACLLRSTSLRAAGLDDTRARYLWADLSAPSLQDAAHTLARAPGHDDELQAWAAVAAMERFAARASENLSDSKPAHVLELSRACDLAPDNVVDRLAQLTARHREEWDGFCEPLGKGSFINSFRNRLEARRP